MAEEVQRSIAIEVVIRTTMSDNDLDDFSENILKEVKGHLRKDESVVDVTWEDFDKILSDLDRMDPEEKYKYLRIFSQAIEQAWERLPRPTVR